jgi:hypothetical protein
MTRVLLIALVLALASTAAFANDVYRTVDRDGTVIYSDRPLSAASQLVTMAAQPADPPAAADPPRETAPRRESPREPESLAAAMEAQAELRAQACLEARQTAEAYERAPRLYEQLPDGGRRYLSNEELLQARANARQAVIDFCDD